MNYKLLIISIVLSLILLSYIGISISQEKHFKYSQISEKGYYYIDRIIDNETNNTCYIFYGTQFGGAIGSFGSISCVNNKIININITGENK